MLDCYLICDMMCVGSYSLLASASFLVFYFEHQRKECSFNFLPGNKTQSILLSALGA